MSATGPVAFQRAGDSLYYVKRQLLSGILPGLLLFALFAVIDYKILKKLAAVFLVATFGLLVLVYLPGIGVTVGGGKKLGEYWPGAISAI